MTTLHVARRPDSPSAPAVTLPLWRINLMRVGYALMGLGLAVVEWPMVPDARELPLFKGVVVCILTAMSVLALLGLRHPVRLLPVLLFESAWKVLWLLAVAVPTAAAGDVDAEMSRVISSCALVVVVLAVIPWRHAWRQYVSTPGDPWRT